LKKSGFETKRQVIGLLDVRVVLNVEDGQEVAYVKCELGQDALIVSNTTQPVDCQTRKQLGNCPAIHFLI
jgi:hypothetical protein